MTAIGALLAAAEAVGAAGRMLDDACRYAGERRQFGRTIGSYQALRHLLAEMYVRHASSWSTVLYAAAALDDDCPTPSRPRPSPRRTYARAAREVAHGAMQVFGGIAFTEEHPAHRFLRRIIVREQQFGDAAHHERALGRRLADRAAARDRPSSRALRPGQLTRDVPLSTGFNDPTAQRLERIATGAEPGAGRPGARRGHARSALGRMRRRPDLRRQVQPHLPRRVATPARRSCAGRRSGTSCRPPTTWRASTAS